MFNKGNKSFSTCCFYRCFLEAKTGESLINPDRKKIQTPGRSQTNLLGFLNRFCRHFGLPGFFGPNNFQTHREAVTWNENCQVPKMITEKSKSQQILLGHFSISLTILGVKRFPFWTADFSDQLVWPDVVWIHVVSKVQPSLWQHISGASAIRFLGLYTQNQQIRWWKISWHSSVYKNHQVFEKMSHYLLGHLAWLF